MFLTRRGQTLHTAISQLGVSSEYMRSKIRVCVEEMVAMEQRLAAKLHQLEGGDPSAPAPDLDEDTPSAPAEEGEETAPSAPALIQTFLTPECVVCLEQKVRLLVPAGCNDTWQIISTFVLSN